MIYRWYLPLLVLLLLWFVLVSAKALYAKPTCPEGNVSCMTLTQYATQPNNFFASNTTLILLPGNHNLDSELVIRHITYLTISTLLSDHSAEVTCSQSARFRFEDIGHVNISFVRFVGCTAKISFTAESDSNNFVFISQCIFVGSDTQGSGFGVLDIDSANMTIEDCSFLNNTAVLSGGAISVFYCSVVNVKNCTFVSNTARFFGGVVRAESSVVSLENCKFINNTADHGGAVYVEFYGGNTFSRRVRIEDCIFINNRAVRGGGAVYVKESSVVTMSVDACTFINNTALSGSGGAMSIDSRVFSIHDSKFINNTATIGASMSIINHKRIAVGNTTFINNTAVIGGGGAAAIYGYGASSVVKVHHSQFISNTAGSARNGKYVGGGALNIVKVSILVIGKTTFVNNRASSDGGGLHVDGSSVNLTDINFIHNLATSGAAVLAFNSILTVSGNTSFMNNSVFSCEHSQCGSQEGGALASFQSDLHFWDTVNMLYNEAENGGAISATESKIYMHGDIRIADNRALQSGGGIYAFQTELNVKRNVTISGNKAIKNGGGIFAISSTIKVLNSLLRFHGNHAERGGGVCLELNAKLYIIKTEYDFEWNAVNLEINFMANSADYGGAVYVHDDTNSGTCSATPSTEYSITSECFFQVLALYSDKLDASVAIQHKLIHLNFTNNTAKAAGGTLFGGLLDRCTVNRFADAFTLYPSSSVINATLYLLNVTNLEESDLIFSKISSYSVRLCFCRNSKPDCNYHPFTKYILKGSLFTVSMVAVDHVNNTVPNSIIHSSLFSGDGRLSEGQAIQRTNNSCTELQYNAFSPHDNEILFLYAEGPCNDTAMSARHINITFKHSPIGFKASQDGGCLCDPALSPYITTDCFIDNQTVLRVGDFWITYINGSERSDEYPINSFYGNESQSDDGFDMSGFIIKPHCPFDYCHPYNDEVYINFNIPNGADAQCAFNRTGILCGSCGENLSLSLGNSHCISCSNDWLALLILFTIAGVALVAFLLVLNLTVAVGTINGLIFYANIIAANSSIFLPFDKPNFLTVFIAWLNLDFGFESCFYDGMDGYAKVWLQLVFPCYIIFLVAMVIIVCEYSHRFSRLLSYTNPVATLATLILLSYAKLLRTIIAALSFTTLEYPDGSHTTMWLYDANVPYLKGKHIPLFIAAVLILLVGLVYTFLLMFWQLLLWVSDKQQVKWLSCNYEIGMLRRWYVGMQHFIDMYHAPYNSKHRYWTGLLLLLRGVLYLISAVNVLGDPSVNFLSIVCAVVLLLMWKLVAQRIYKTDYLSNLDTLFLVNLCIFTTGTLYLREIGSGNHTALAYTSTSIAFITFLGILFYHTKLQIPQYLYELVKKKTHHDSHHLSIRAEECGTVEEQRELVPPSPTVSVTSFDGLPDQGDWQDDGDREKDGEEADSKNQCEDSVIELINIFS